MPIRVLVTGFGSFPGARHNPTALLVYALRGHRASLTRLGIELELGDPLKLLGTEPYTRYGFWNAILCRRGYTRRTSAP